MPTYGEQILAVVRFTKFTGDQVIHFRGPDKQARHKPRESHGFGVFAGLMDLPYTPDATIRLRAGSRAMKSSAVRMERPTKQC